MTRRQRQYWSYGDDGVLTQITENWFYFMLYFISQQKFIIMRIRETHYRPNKNTKMKLYYIQEINGISIINFTIYWFIFPYGEWEK